MFTVVMSSQLNQYLSDNPEAAADFHERIGVTRQALDRYRKGERIPKPAPMAKIYAATDGAVDPNSFYKLPSLTSRRPASAKRETAGR